MKSRGLLTATGLVLILATLAFGSGIWAPLRLAARAQTTLAAPNAPNAQLVNGDFESGPGVGWTEYSLLGQPVIVDDRALKNFTDVTPHSGSWLAWLGGTEDADEVSYIKQQVTIDAGTPMLAYWQWIESIDVCGWDWARVLVNGAEASKFSLCMNTNTGAWVRRTVDLSAYIGQTVWVQFQANTNQWNWSSWFVDDVALEAGAGPTRTPTATATATRTPANTAASTTTASRTATATPTSSATASPTGTASSTATATPSSTPTSSATASRTGTPTASRTPTSSAMASPTATATDTATSTPRAALTGTSTAIATPTNTPSVGVTPTETPTLTARSSGTTTPSPSASRTVAARTYLPVVIR